MIQTANEKFRTLANHEATPGVLLIAKAVFALLLDNSPLDWIYDALLTVPVAIQAGSLIIDKPLLLWINDVLMAVFFFLVGLEIKRELMTGHLSDMRTAALPAIAAFGGMLVPALIFTAFNAGSAEEMRGWAIPAATDIAFALGILALLGSRAPVALKVLLLAVAIIDDLGAIAIIAVFFTADLSWAALAVAAIALIALSVVNLSGVTRIAPYLLIGVIMWVAVLKSGVHATLAGVIVAFFIPLKAEDEDGQAPLLHLEHKLAPWVAFFIMPVFAFANAGVHLGGITLSDFLAPLPLGIALGLFVGKQIGVFGFTWAATKSGLCRLPEGINWAHVYGVAALAGIGFNMSLFIGTLAFEDPEHAKAVRIGVLTGSTFSAILGYILLRMATSADRAETAAAS